MELSLNFGESHARRLRDVHVDQPTAEETEDGKHEEIAVHANPVCQHLHNRSEDTDNIFEFCCVKNSYGDTYRFFNS